MQANQSTSGNNVGCEDTLMDGDGLYAMGVPNGTCHNGSAVNGVLLDQGQELGLQNQGQCQMSQTDQDIIRLIAQHLRILGMNRTVDQLAAESGCVLEHPAAALFRNHVMNGEWEQAEAGLSELQSLVNSRSDVTKMKFLMLEQKYLELLEDGLLMDALNCLRNQVTPLKYNVEQVHRLSTYLMCSTAEDLRSAAKWTGKGPTSRINLLEQLQVFLPTNVMIPQRRLQELLQQALQMQTQQCQYHNFSTPLTLDNVSLLTNHVCSKDQFPSVTTQILTDHTDEVLYCKFSPSGTMLATGSKDGTMSVYDVDMKTHKLTQRKQYSRHRNGVAYLAWSPDSQYIIACGPPETNEIIIWNIVTGEQHLKMNQTTDDSLTTAAWHSDSARFVAAGIRGQFFQCNLDGGMVETWHGVRVQCLACLPDAKTVLGADTHNRIRAYNFDDLTDFTYFKEDHSIMSFTLNKAGDQALLNVAAQGVHLWDLSSRSLIRKFHGITQGFFMIYSCFGGVNQSFVASGSEDQKVYIWHINRESPIAQLEGHTRTVNCVDWNPVIHSMLASASDDNTVRVWGPAPPEGSAPVPEPTPTSSTKVENMSSCESVEDISAV